jgi:flavin-dependent dehydrogenase
MKVIIIGGSIAGVASAYQLAGKNEIAIYEQKKRSEVGKKVCANVYTFMIKSLLKEYGLDYRKYASMKFSRFSVFSKNNHAEFKTEEYEFDRAKLLEALIKKAENKGAKFFFNTNFVGFKKKNKKFIVTFKRGNKTFEDYADILVGADGAVSEVAKKSGLWGKRKFFLALQANVKNIRKYAPGKNSYSIMLGKDFGYYSYIFPAKKGFIAGLEERPEKNVRKKFMDFLKIIGVKGAKIEGALIPEPKVIKLKKGIFLVGDAGCQVKFTGGGVIPAFMGAKALKFAVEGNFKAYKKLNSRIKLNRLAVYYFNSMTDKKADKIIKIVKNKEFKDAAKYRDYFDKNHFKRILNPRIVLALILSMLS